MWVIQMKGDGKGSGRGDSGAYSAVLVCRLSTTCWQFHSGFVALVDCTRLKCFRQADRWQLLLHQWSVRSDTIFSRDHCPHSPWSINSQRYSDRSRVVVYLHLVSQIFGNAQRKRKAMFLLSVPLFKPTRCVWQKVKWAVWIKKLNDD